VAILQYILGVDIGGTKCAVILGSYDPEAEEKISVINKIKFSTETQKGAQQIIGQIIEGIEEILKESCLKTTDIYGIGISCGGPLDSKSGIIMSPPNLVGWDNIPIVDILEKKFAIKTYLQNDANACCLAEWKFGAARGYQNVVFLTFGTGMGAGLILNGQLYSGTNDMAGEIGHIRLENNGPVGYGKQGSFEGFCSGGGIAQLGMIKVLEKLQMGEKVSFCDSVDKLRDLDAKIIADAGEAGDELAIEIYRTCGHYLGRGLSILIDLLNPEIIVIGSVFSRSRNLLWESAEEVIESEALHHARSVCSIVPNGLGEEIGDFAALAVALNN
jgi:glucokinase